MSIASGRLSYRGDAMTIYLDSEYHCHLAAGEGMQAVETDVFDGKCQAYIEGYRFIPVGKTWVRKDGAVFCGEMVAPFVDYSILYKVQEQYELDMDLSKDMREALNILGVTEE